LLLPVTYSRFQSSHQVFVLDTLMFVFHLPMLPGNGPDMFSQASHFSPMLQAGKQASSHFRQGNWGNSHTITHNVRCSSKM
jgi:hypothetical protein